MQSIIIFFLLLAPRLSFAQAPRTFAELVRLLLRIIDVLIPAVFALTFIVLIWGIIKAWILNAGDANEIEQGKRLVVIGVVALVIMSGIWGILELLRRSLFG